VSAAVVERPAAPSPAGPLDDAGRCAYRWLAIDTTAKAQIRDAVTRLALDVGADPFAVALCVDVALGLPASEADGGRLVEVLVDQVAGGGVRIEFVVLGESGRPLRPSQPPPVVAVLDLETFAGGDGWGVMIAPRDPSPITAAAAARQLFSGTPSTTCT